MNYIKRSLVKEKIKDKIRTLGKIRALLLLLLDFFI